MTEVPAAAAEAARYCSETEAQLTLLRSLPEAQRYAPMVALVLFADTTQEVALCTATQDVGRPERHLYFPQGSISANKTASQAFLLKAPEKVGLPTDAIVALHGLAGTAILGTTTGQRRKIVLPIIGITEEAFQLHPKKGELATANWYSLEAARTSIESQLASSRQAAAATILRRFSAWHSTYY